MKNKTFYFIVMFLVITFVMPVKAAHIISFDSSGKICDAVKNKTIQIGVSKANGSTSIIPSPSNTCINTSVFNDNKSKIKNQQMSFVKFGVMHSNSLYIDDVKLNSGYFYISNASRYSNVGTDNFGEYKTLISGEKQFILLDILNKKITSNNKKDVRVTLKYGTTSSDVNFDKRDSIRYYVITSDNKEYGPFKLFEENYDNHYIIKEEEKNTELITYNIISENLFKKDIPNNKTIKAIKIIPYANGGFRGGYLRLFSISLDEYSSYSSGKKYNTIDAITLRKNIVNNMMDNATIRWSINNSKKIKFYSGISTNPRIFSSDTIYYGTPYVNNINSTINSFKSMATYDKTKGIYYYNLPTTYIVSTKASNKKIIKKGDKVTNPLLVHESGSADTVVTDDAGVDESEKNTREKEVPNSTFVYNTEDGGKSGYFFGQDCSSAVLAAVYQELSYIVSIHDSNSFYTSSQVILLGNLNYSLAGLEKYLRNEAKKKVLGPKTNLTLTILKENYTEYIKVKNSKQKIYNAYGLVIPGDVIDMVGHTRLATGYPVVVCNNGATVGGSRTTKYSNGYCDKNNRGGINPQKSYVISTEVGNDNRNTAFTPVKDADNQIMYYTKVKSDNGKTVKYLTSKSTGWSYTLNKNLTNLKSINDYYTLDENNSGKTNFRVNKIYYFDELYNNKNNDIGAIYLPFRFKLFTTVTNGKIKVEQPTAKLVLDKKESNPGGVLFEYKKSNGKLKGTIFTNYVIDAVRFNIDSKNYYIYPNQTNIFSLYSDIKNSSINNAIKKAKTITISVKLNDKYVKVVDIKAPTATATPKPTVTATPKPKATATPKVTATSTPKITKTYAKGDVNGDGKVGSTDYILIRKHILKNPLLTGANKTRADVNGDGTISSIDYITIKKIIQNSK